jgi:drug/metabolite transporter (DMT)-like permease
MAGDGASPIKGYLCVVTAALCWASCGVAGKALLQAGVGVFDLVQVRITLSACLLAMTFAVFARHLFRIRLRDLVYFFALGGVFMALNNAAYFYAISKIQVAAAILLQYLAPVIVAFFSILFWRERLTRFKLLALILAVGGCYLVVGGYNLQILRMNQEGILGGLAAAVCFSGYTLMGERGMHRHSPWTVLFYAIVFAALSWHILMSPFRYLTAGFTLPQWGWLLYIAILGTIVPFGLYLMGVNHIRSTRAIITATLEPISAGAISFLLLGETLAFLQIAGGILVIGAIALLQLEREHDSLAPAAIRLRSREKPASRTL